MCPVLQSLPECPRDQEWQKGAPYTAPVPQQLNGDAQPSRYLPVTCIALPVPVFLCSTSLSAALGGMRDRKAGKGGTKDA